MVSLRHLLGGPNLTGLEASWDHGMYLNEFYKSSFHHVLSL